MHSGLYRGTLPLLEGQGPEVALQFGDTQVFRVTKMCKLLYSETCMTALTVALPCWLMKTVPSTAGKVSSCTACVQHCLPSACSINCFSCFLFASDTDLLGFPLKHYLQGLLQCLLHTCSHLTLSSLCLGKALLRSLLNWPNEMKAIYSNASFRAARP